MRRFLKLLASLSIIEAIGRYPAIAGTVTLMGIGSVVISSGGFTTPTIIPQPTSFFNNGNNGAAVNNGVKTPTGAFQVPTTVTHSFGILLDGSVSAGLNANGTAQYALGSGAGTVPTFQGLFVSGNGAGLPTWYFQKLSTTGASTWSQASGYDLIDSGPTSAGTVSAYSNGYYIATASPGSSCIRPPSIVWGGIGNSSTQTGAIDLSDPGFLCPTATATLVAIPGTGAQQATLASSPGPTTCAPNAPVTGNFTVTTNVAVPHLFTPGQTYTLSGFTPAGFNTTYLALPGSTGTTIVGMPSTATTGTCPASTATAEGHFQGMNGGTGATIALPPTVTVGATGITTKNNQHFCAAIVENGDDSPFPGSQAIAMVDDHGNPLPGSPSVIPYLNQGTANFNGFITTGTQSAGHQALTVTSMASYTITGATYSGTTGFVTFTTSTSPMFEPGSEFTVTGMTPSGYNQTYVAVAGTTLTSTTIVGNPLNGPIGNFTPSNPTAGTPLAISNPGSFVSGGTMVSVIMPGMRIYGENLTTAVGIISPFGTFGGTGIGGTGTYATTTNPASFAFGFSIPSTGILTIAGATVQTLTLGTNFTGTDSNGSCSCTSVQITGFGTGTGLNGTYQTNYAALGGTGTFTTTTVNGVGTSGSPALLFAVPPFFQSIVGVAGTLPGSPSTSFTTTAASQSAIGDFVSVIGTQESTTAPGNPAADGWSGTLSDVAMLWMPGASGTGGFPAQIGGGPSTSALAGLCQRNPNNDLQQFATANGFTVHSDYRLNDLGIFADSSEAQFTGSISGTALTISSTQTGSIGTQPTTPATVIAGAGITGCPSSCPTIVSGSGGSYVLSASGGTVSSEAMTAGNFVPAVPTPTSAVEGWIDQVSTVPTLHVASTTSSASNLTVSFTGSLNVPIIAKIDNGAGAAGNILTVTSPALGNAGLLQNPYIGIGTTITIPSGSPATDTVAGLITGGGATGQYLMAHSQASLITSQTMHASGLLPGLATNLTVSGVTGGAISAGMLVTDGGANITGPPIQTVGAVNSGDVAIVPTYYPTFSSDTTMQGTLSTIVPGQYVLNSAITTPTKVIGYGTGNGLLGSYPLSVCPNAGCAVGSSGSPTTVFTTTAVTDGAPVSTPALIVKDFGSGTTFPITSNMSGCTFGSCSATGTVPISGTFDISALGGTPTTIQAQVSLTADGPPVPGCSACAWSNLSGYTAVPQTLTASITTGGVMTPSVVTAPTLSIGQSFSGVGYSGTVTGLNTSGPIPTYSVTPSPGSAIGPEAMTVTNVKSWSGSVLNIPATAAPVYISVRASNGTAYAQLQNSIRIGIVVEGNGEGQFGTCFSGGQGGNAVSTFTGGTLGISDNGSGGFFQAGPPIAGALIPGAGLTFPQPNDRFSVQGIGSSECSVDFQQGLTTALGGVSTWWATVLRDGIGIEPLVYGNALQTQTVGVQNSGATLTTWCSQAKFCSNPSVAGVLLFNGASLSGGQITARIDNGTVGTPGNTLTLVVNGTFTASTTSGVMTVTTAPTNSFQLSVGTAITGVGYPVNTTIASLGSGTGGAGTYNLSTSFTKATETVTASISRGAAIWGTLEPGAVLSDTTSNITGSPALLNCITGCIPFAGTSPTVPFYCSSSPCYPNVQTWAISGSAQSVLQENMSADIPQSGGTPWPQSSNEGGFPLFTTFGYVMIKAGTFKISVNGTVVCQDTSVPLMPYNNQTGNCTDSGGHNLGWVDYMTADYQWTPLSPPAANAVIIASWVDYISPDNGTLLYQRPAAYDFFGDGTPNVGPVASALSKSPAGVSAHIFAGGQGLQGTLIRQGYPYGVPYSREISWLYATRFPRDIPGNSPNAPALFGHVWGVQGPSGLTNIGGNPTDTGEGNMFSQWIHDVATPSTFFGTVGSVTNNGANAILTLTTAATGQVWEGEVLGCNPSRASCPLGTGTYIQQLCTAALCGTVSPAGFGANGSTYFLTAISTAETFISAIATPISMTNAMYYTGPGGGFNIGPYNDQNIQGGGLVSSAGVGPHGGSGQQGMGRIGRRMGCLTWGALTNKANCQAPFPDRNAADALGCDSQAISAPCFDIGATFATTATATNATTLTLTFAGLPAHTIPISDGQAVTCTGCASGLFVVSVDHPSTQDTRAGQGQVGSLNPFVVTLNATPGIGAGHAFTFGCKGTAGVGSNCVDIAYTIPTVGTYGTPASLGNCGANNANGNAPYNLGGLYGNGSCQTNGVGEIVRNFAIGSNQFMWGGTGFSPTGHSYYDDGVEPLGSSSFNQSGAFTCHIASAKVIQCVLGPTYVSGIATTIGQWASGNTFVEQGDNLTGNARINTLMGYVGGQSFPITSPGSNQMPGTYSFTPPKLAPTSSTYTSTSGIIAMTFASAPFGATVGSLLNGTTVTVSNFLPSATNTALLGAGGTAVLPIVSTGTAGTVINVQGPVGAGTLSITAASGVLAGCGTNLGSLGGFPPTMDLTIGSGGTVIDAYPSTTANSMGTANGAGCTFIVPAAALTPPGATPGFVTVPYGVPEGFGGIASPADDNNLKSIGPYDNTMIPGNPLAPFQANCPVASGYCEPGLAAEAIGLFLGELVSG